jgi:hypothetical protein
MSDAAKVVEAREGESLEQVQERFKLWRETRGRGEHIPRVMVTNQQCALDVLGAGWIVLHMRPACAIMEQAIACLIVSHATHL